MFFAQPHSAHMTSKPEVRSSIHIPMVYEQVVSEPARWEYHVLSVDTREAALPDAEQLNTLGKQGWILASMLDERTSNGKFVHYYFARQIQV